MARRLENVQGATFIEIAPRHDSFLDRRGMKIADISSLPIENERIGPKETNDQDAGAFFKAFFTKIPSR